MFLAFTGRIAEAASPGDVVVFTDAEGRRCAAALITHTAGGVAARLSRVSRAKGDHLNENSSLSNSGGRF